MFTLDIERFLWPWEKKRFKQLKALVENSPHHYVCEIRGEVDKLLAGKYATGEGGTHIWIHRKRSHNRLACIYRE